MKTKTKTYFHQETLYRVNKFLERYSLTVEDPLRFLPRITAIKASGHRPGSATHMLNLYPHECSDGYAHRLFLGGV